METEGDEEVLVVGECVEELALVTSEGAGALVDYAGPTTVSGKRWMETLVINLKTFYKSMVNTVESDKIYKFWGGEKPRSLGKVVFPCYIAGKNVRMEAEVIEADFPLILGNLL